MALFYPPTYPPHLQTLSLNNNQLSGMTPDLNHFSHLETVNLGNNQLTTTIDDNDVTIILPPPFVSNIPLCPTAIY
jgi:Leucine-rich repeat (LRR) protein